MSKELGSTLEKLRGNLPLRIASKKIGVSHTYLRNLEIGERDKPSIEVLKRIAEVYDHPYVDLLEKAGYIDEAEKELLTPIDLVKEPKPVSDEDKKERERLARNKRDARKFLEQADIMFDGVPMTEEDKQRILGFMEGMFWEAKEMNRRKPKE